MQFSASTLGFIAAAFNFNILTFNVLFFRADAIAALGPGMFSRFGQLMVLVWGVAYATAGLSNPEWPIYLSFSLEKTVYVLGWIRWHRSNDVAELLREAKASEDRLELLAPLFFIAFGLVDLAFAVIFLVYALTLYP